MTDPKIYELRFEGGVLARGFWLYVWQITTPEGGDLYYVGRTGDSSSSNAQSPFNRMSQHLGFNLRSNVLRKRLTGTVHNLDLEKCRFKLIALGPLFSEEKTMASHRRPLDIVAGLEKALADSMTSAGYCVINPVACLKPIDSQLFKVVHDHFKQHFDRLN